MISECGDGDVWIYFKNRKHMLEKMKQALLKKFDHWHDHGLEEGREGALLSDRCNENVVLTTDESVFNESPPWVGMKIMV
jgi:hypothetical protein